MIGERSKIMKYFICFSSFFLLTFANVTFSQGIFFPNPDNFVIISTGPLPQNASDPPYGGAYLANNVLSIFIEIGPTAATQGWIMERASNPI